MPEQISVAVIGAGMAGRSHAAAYRMAGSVSGPGLPPIRLAAIADANVALAEDGARRYGYEKALPSWEAVAEDPSIDAVSIVVGNALHRPIAEALVAAGKHVLCEKPLAGSMEDARAMVELEKRGTVVTAVGYCYRRSPAIAAIRDHIRAGELGELTTLHARYWCDYACDPRGPLSWRFKGGMGSGALGDIGAHVIDQGEYLCGPDRVGVRRQRLDPDRQAAAAARCGRRARRRAGQQRDGRGRERGHRHVHRPVPVGSRGHLLGVAHRVRHAERPGLRRLRDRRAGARSTSTGRRSTRSTTPSPRPARRGCGG